MNLDMGSNVVLKFIEILHFYNRTKPWVLDFLLGSDLSILCNLTTIYLILDHLGLPNNFMMSELSRDKSGKLL